MRGRMRGIDSNEWESTCSCDMLRVGWNDFEKKKKKKKQFDC